MLRFLRARMFLWDGLRPFSSMSQAEPLSQMEVTILNTSYPCDDYTNVTPRIIGNIGQNLYQQPNHPLHHIKKRICDYFHREFRNPHNGNPEFSVHENIPPPITVQQHFDDLLVPTAHASRNPKDSYYINRQHMLRAHMTAYQGSMIKSGLDSFLLVGDVYRRDEIDRTHFPVFHQIDGVRLRTADQLFGDKEPNAQTPFASDPQTGHTAETVRMLEADLKLTLENLMKYLFGPNIRYRWNETQFPFTHPSWELEIQHDCVKNGRWLEILGCGIMRQEILTHAGASDKVGWAFGLGLERLAMLIYKISDIRLFWTNDSGFLCQFRLDPYENITYRTISAYPQCYQDMSFWLPTDRDFSANDFYDIVRTVGGDLVEQVDIFDVYSHPKTKRTSNSYHIVYRHMLRYLTNKEVSVVHRKIGEKAEEKLGVILRM